MKKRHSDECTCPYCEEELRHHCVEPDFCKPCGVAVVKCVGCGESFNAALQQCPKCKAPRAEKKK